MWSVLILQKWYSYTTDYRNQSDMFHILHIN